MYSNDTEYRQYFRKITGMREQVFHHEPGHINLNEGIPEDMDDITLDEYMYDEEAVSNTVNSMYQKTKDDFRFQQMYDLAAARIISTDREMGIPVLMTYDFLWLFYECYTAYVENRPFDDLNAQLISALRTK